jgi:hypothetical protein
MAIRSNSEPWIENPRSLADAEAISDSVERSTDAWPLKMIVQESVAHRDSYGNAGTRAPLGAVISPSRPSASGCSINTDIKKRIRYLEAKD